MATMSHPQFQLSLGSPQATLGLGSGAARSLKSTLSVGSGATDSLLSLKTGAGVGWKRGRGRPDSVPSSFHLHSSTPPRGLRLRASAAEAPAPAASGAPALLKEAAKDKKVPGPDLVKALLALEKASRAGPAPPDAVMLEGLGGTKSPGRMWRLIFTTNGKTDSAAASGSYFPLPARQRFDAEAMEIENGVYLGPVGYLTFTGPFSFKSRRLSFLFHTLRLKLGPLPEFKFDISSDKTRGRIPGEGKEGKEDPFFIWFYVDDDVVVGRGRGGGVAYWNKYEGNPRG